MKGRRRSRAGRPEVRCAKPDWHADSNAPSFADISGWEGEAAHPQRRHQQMGMSGSTPPSCPWLLTGHLDQLHLLIITSLSERLL
eukprot:1159491-Pelagomonas_calceolata.AAC.13